MKKIILYFIIIIFIIISLIIIFFLNKKENISFENLENNIVKIIKEADIIKINENPKWFFWSDWNTKELISSWFFINKKTIITVAHWVNNEKSIYIINDNFWNIYEWILIKKDIENDLAFLEINEEYKYFKEFNYAKNIKVWENIFSIWYKKNNVKFWEIKKIKDDFIFSNIIFEDWESGWIMFNKNYEIIWINQAIDLEKNLWITKIISE